MLGMDGLSSYFTPAMQDRFKDANIVPVYTPANCTDVVAPVDHHIGGRLKTIMAEFYAAELEVNGEQWQRSGALSASRYMYDISQCLTNLCPPTPSDIFPAP